MCSRSNNISQLFCFSILCLSHQNRLALSVQKTSKRTAGLAYGADSSPKEKVVLVLSAFYRDQIDVGPNTEIELVL